MKNMNIASVKLVNGGLKGVIVTYSMTSEKDKRSFLDEHVSKKKAPIHQELEEAFDSLKEPLLDICGYSKEEVEDVIIVSISYSSKGFVIVGKKKILDGNKTINLVTALITGDDYSEFDTVCKTLDAIYSETEDYMSGAKVFSDAQLVMKFNQGKEDFDVDTFNGLSDIEKRDIASKILEDMGHVVLLTDDIGEEPTISREVVEETIAEADKLEEIVQEAVERMPTVEDWEKASAPEPTMTVVDDDNFDMPVTEKPSKKSPLTMVKGENGAFKIIAEEPKTSTAKRKQA